VVIGANADSIFRRLMTLIGRDDLSNDDSLADNAGRCKRVEELDCVIAEWTARYTVDEVVALLNSAQVPNGKIFSIADIARDAQYLARGMIQEVTLPDGTSLKVPGIVPKLSDTPGGLNWVGPDLGEHTQEILLSLGYDAVQIEAMCSRKIV
jgi:crotonobetainyl-CoA:carnitine CoA-transferase CaiB-like acyl-CoA transferase